jgi:phosphohistidine phosphatase
MTPTRLVLVRHAKAKPEGADVARPLAARGRADAVEIGRWLATRGIEPDHVIVSPALRALQTWELAGGELFATTPVHVDGRVYANTVDDLYDVVRESPQQVGTVVVVGHNPSMEALSVALDDGGGDATAVANWNERFPTSGVAILTVACDWADIAAGGGRLEAFAAPRG